MRIQDVKPIVDRLLSLPHKYDQIADFGSGTGWRTLALTFGLASQNVIGTDKERHIVDQARRQIIAEFLEPMFSEIRKLEGFLDRSEVRRDLTEETCSIAEAIISRFSLKPTLQFIQADLTMRLYSEVLPSNHFDMAHSRYCLYQIFCGDSPSPSGVESAIGEMTRVVRSGGLVVAVEPDTCADENSSPFDLKSFFINHGDLAEVYYHVESGLATYIARKT